MPRNDDAIDRRRFGDLVSEAVGIIQTRCPSWTDLSPGDPGMTLVEVYAWLTETMLYRLNRLPDRLYQELLKLLGVSPLPPAAALVSLTFSRTEGLTEVIDLPAGLHVSDQSGKITFTTLEPLRLAAGAAETAIPAVHAELVEAEIIGQGNGDGAQTAVLRRAPVLRRLGTLEELRVGVEHLGGDLPSDARTISIEGKVFVLWDEVSSFSGHTAARCYIADRTAGRITFAPSSGAARAVSATLAEVPPVGAQIRAWYLTGGGRVGNVAIRTLTTLRERFPGLDVTNRERAAGGEDAEVPEAFLTRGRDAVRSLDCAVTADDFTQIALSSGGVARALAFAQRDIWVFGQPGLVEVLVVPQVDPPTATGAVTAKALEDNRTELLRERVAAVIGEKRPIGVRTDIKWANCLPVSVSGRIAAAPSEDINALAGRITKRLNTLLSPLGDWPFGKSLRVSDVYEAILDDPGVRFAEQVTLTTEDGPQGETTRLFSDPHQPRCIYALMADGLYRSLDYATSWERILSWPEQRPMAIAADPDLPGCIAVAGSAPDGTSRLALSNTCGESWIDLETIQHQINDIAFVNQDGRRWIFIATRNGLFRTDCLGPRGLLAVKVAAGAVDSGGFYAVSSGSNQAGAGFVAVAARGKGGVFLSRDGVNFVLLPGSQGLDIRAVDFVRDGGQLWLWAAAWSEGGETGKGVMRIAVRADGLDPDGWKVFSKGWKGGSCLSFEVVGNHVAAGTRDGGVLLLDASAKDPVWRAPLLTSGLPIDADRAKLLPIDAVAIGRGTMPLLLAGTEQGLFRGDADKMNFAPVGGRSFTDRVPLPPNWLYCAGAHQLEFVSDLNARGNTDAPR